MTGLSAGGRVGGRSLGAHLARGAPSAVDALAAELATETTPPSSSRGLILLTIEDQLRELEAGANTRRTRKPLYHVHCNPRWDDEELVELFWRLFEQEFGLTRARFASKKHSKGNRGDHTHRVYDITRADGSVVDMSNDFYRREKIMVIACFMLGRSMPPVPHLRAIIKALKAEGQQDVVRWVEAQPPAPRAVAQRTPAERQVEQRTGSDKGLAADAVMVAWVRSDTGPAFLAALHAAGLDLGQGDNAIMVIDDRGEWPLTRMIGGASREMGQRIGAAAVKARVRGLPLLPIKDARQAIHARARAAKQANAARQAAERREAARRRATVARMPREIEQRADAVRTMLATIRAEKPKAPPNVAMAVAKFDKANVALTLAEAVEAQTADIVERLAAENAISRPWWRRIIMWSTGEGVRLAVAVREATERQAEAEKQVTMRKGIVTAAEVKRDIAVRAWRAEVTADKAARTEPLSAELSFLVRALKVLEREPESALLPPAVFRQAVENDPGQDGPVPRPRWG